MEQRRVGDPVDTKFQEEGGWFPVETWLSMMAEGSLASVDRLPRSSPADRRGSNIKLSTHAVLADPPTRESLFDTGVGNARGCKGEVFACSKTNSPTRPNQARSRDQIDFVLQAHLNEPVMWKTQLIDSRWLPRDPTAHYRFSGGGGVTRLCVGRTRRSSGLPGYQSQRGNPTGRLSFRHDNGPGGRDPSWLRRNLHAGAGNRTSAADRKSHSRDGDSFEFVPRDTRSQRQNEDRFCF